MVVNLRDKPSASGNKIGALAKGIPVKIVEDIDAALAKMNKRKAKINGFRWKIVMGQMAMQRRGC
jgi:hypothetical protein